LPLRESGRFERIAPTRFRPPSGRRFWLPFSANGQQLALSVHSID
jgi:hypothetical protein